MVCVMHTAGLQEVNFPVSFSAEFLNLCLSLLSTVRYSLYICLCLSSVELFLFLSSLDPCHFVSTS